MRGAAMAATPSAEAPARNCRRLLRPNDRNLEISLILTLPVGRWMCGWLEAKFCLYKNDLAPRSACQDEPSIAWLPLDIFPSARRHAAHYECESRSNPGASGRSRQLPPA